MHFTRRRLITRAVFSRNVCVYSVYTFDLVLRGLYNLILAGLAARIIQDEPSLSAD